MRSMGIARAKRAAVVEAHVFQRHRAVEVLRTLPLIDGAESFPSMAELVVWMRTAPRSSWPHLLVVDPGVGAEMRHDMAVVRALRSWGMRVVVLSSLDSRLLIRRIASVGVDGIVSKQDAESVLLDTVEQVLTGSTSVSDRAQAIIDADPAPKLSVQETRLLELYATGRSLSSVAERLGVKEDTARKYLKRVKLKYDAQGRPAHSKLELAWRAREDGFLDPSALTAAER